MLGGLRRWVEAPFVALLSSTTIGWLVSPYWLQPNFHQKLSRETSQAALSSLQQVVPSAGAAWLWWGQGRNGWQVLLGLSGLLTTPGSPELLSVSLI